MRLAEGKHCDKVALRLQPSWLYRLLASMLLLSDTESLETPEHSVTHVSYRSSVSERVNA